MRLWQPALSALLASTLLLGNTALTWADSMWVPRLGFPMQGVKRVYLDVMPDDAQDAAEKAAKERQEAEEEAQKEQLKVQKRAEEEQREAEKATQKAMTKEEREALKAKREAEKDAEANLSKEERKALKAKQDAEAQAQKEAERAQKEQTKQARETLKQQLEQQSSTQAEQANLDKKARKAQEEAQKAERKAAKQALKDAERQLAKNSPEALNENETRKRAQTNRYLRQKALIQARDAKRQKEPVEGAFYLYSLKQNRLLYKNPSEILAGDVPDGKGKFYVDFANIPNEGLYDVAVRGSGHRSEQALWISDSIYWDALLPVLQDFTKAHCPLVKGRHLLLHECFNTEAFPMNKAMGDNTPPQLIQGGWYLAEPTAEGEVKNTMDIANTAQLFMNMYALNPASYKYVNLNGDGYAETRYPDLLDEAAWGMQYLVTVQQTDGSFPAGIRQDENTAYWLQPTSSKATARAVMALATAAKTFKTEDLSQSVKFLRSAEKGWRALQGQNISPEDYLLMSYALSQVSDNPKYAEMYQLVRGKVSGLSPQTALLLGPESKNYTLQADHSTGSDVTSWLPLMAKVQNENDAAAAERLTQHMTDLFGYEKVTLKRDMRFAVTNPLGDPLQWMATKTGEVATRFGQHLQDSGVLKMEDPTTVSDDLKVIEEKEASARTRIAKGYKQLNLNPEEKLVLAYGLAILNQYVATGYNPVDDKRKKDEAKLAPKPLYDAPIGAPKSFYPKEL